MVSQRPWACILSSIFASIAQLALLLLCFIKLSLPPPRLVCDVVAASAASVSTMGVVFFLLGRGWYLRHHRQARADQRRLRRRQVSKDNLLTSFLFLVAL